ncbi:hypothetical protein [Streptomyces sp. NBC_01546]|uniref:hypothetical protein n=1 Tax=Streptomyces sp. NBC_01546 TaxID=2975872 RepID=UPI003862E47B
MQMTKSASDFYEQHFLNVKHFALSPMMADRYDEFLQLALEVFAFSENYDRRELVKVLAKMEILKEFLQEIKGVMREVAVTRTVDNFLSYVADILTEIMIARPEVLKSQEQVSMKEVLEHDSLEEFTRWAAERHVGQLSFKGLAEISEYISKRLGLALHVSPSDQALLVKSVAIRNLVVHRRSVVDLRFIRSFGDRCLVAGDKFDIPADVLPDAIGCTLKAVAAFDAQAATKFGIARIPNVDLPWYMATNGPHRLSGG